jgi:hypothetical protein
MQMISYDISVKTFGEKTNVSNSTGTDSVNQEISAAGNNLYISWWEVQKNGTMEPVLRSVALINGNEKNPCFLYIIAICYSSNCRNDNSNNNPNTTCIFTGSALQ